MNVPIYYIGTRAGVRVYVWDECLIVGRFMTYEIKYIIILLPNHIIIYYLYILTFNYYKLYKLKHITSRIISESVFCWTWVTF